MAIPLVCRSLCTRVLHGLTRCSWASGTRRPGRPDTRWFRPAAAGCHHRRMGRTNRRGTRETARTRTFRGGPRITTGIYAVCRLDAAAHASSTVFLMHSQPNGECASRCLQTEALQLSFKKVSLCRGTRQVHALTRLIAMAPIDGATKFLSHELLWAPAVPAQRTKVGRAPLAPE